MSGHTKEPWALSEGQPDNIEGVFYESCLRDRWCRDPICSEEDAARVVVCVNAMQGISDPAAYVAASKAREAALVEAAYREGYAQGANDTPNHLIADDAWRCSQARAALTKEPDA